VGHADLRAKSVATAVPSCIVLDEKGVAWIEDTATKVMEVALTKRVSGLTPEQLQEELPHLSVAQIYSALAYYYAHKDELDAEIERRKQWAEQMAAQAGESPFVKRLRVLGKLPG
jgi:uncharacterized protein (DUF433 family)